MPPIIDRISFEPSLDHSTLDPGALKFRAKDGLSYSVRTSRRGSYYVVEDGRVGQFFKLGLQEASLLSLFDGKRTLNEVLALHSQHFSDSRIDESKALEICSFLLDSGLISTEASRSFSRISKRFKQSRQMRIFQWINPVCLSVPLFNPDRLFNCIHRLTRWIPGWVCTVVLLIVISLGILEFLRHLDEITINRVFAYSAYDWLWMLLGWGGVKLAHELGHGIVCKRFGGEIKRCGLLLFMFIPLPFVDVTSTWRFPSRWSRIAVASAGIIVELFLASIAIYFWKDMEAGSLKFYIEDLIVASMIHTFVFNMNPLMKFDGYYIFSDLLDIPNLSVQGRRFANALTAKLFIDAGIALPRFPNNAWIIAIYGIAARCWLFALSSSIIIGAFNLAPGIGLVLAILALTASIIPMIQFCSNQLVSFGALRFQRFKRLCLSVVGCVAIIGIGFLVVPAPRYIQAPAVFKYQNEVIIRSDVQGFVKEIFVHDQQFVKGGDLIARIENPSISRDKIKLTSEIISEELRLRQYRFDKDIASELAALERLRGLNKQLEELVVLESRQDILAPTDGVIIATELESKLDTFVNPGDFLLIIADQGSLQALAMVSQQQAVRIASGKKCGRIVSLGVDGEVLECKIENIAPRASSLVHHRALTAPYGGPLEVVRVPDAGVSNSQVIGRRDVEVLDVSNTNYESGYMLTDPQVSVLLSFDHSKCAVNHSGIVVVAHIDAERQSLGDYLLGRFLHWFQRDIKHFHGI